MSKTQIHVTALPGVTYQVPCAQSARPRRVFMLPSHMWQAQSHIWARLAYYDLPRECPCMTIFFVELEQLQLQIRFLLVLNAFSP